MLLRAQLQVRLRESGWRVAARLDPDAIWVLVPLWLNQPLSWMED